MRCIDNRSTDIYFNLAVEEYLLKERQEDYFMLWQSEPTVVVGKYQSVRAEADEELLRRRQIRLARRFSGGGAVYHDRGNLNLTFVETAEKPDFVRFLRAVTDFLQGLGIAAETDSRNGIYVDGRKISGSAQCIYKNRVMYHCTLLFDTDLAMLDAALSGNRADDLLPGSHTLRAVASVHSPVVNIAAKLPETMGVERFRELLFGHFLSADKENRKEGFRDEDIAQIERLKAGRYATPEWIYNRS